jgi:hypothetical protein
MDPNLRAILLKWLETGTALQQQHARARLEIAETTATTAQALSTELQLQKSSLTPQESKNINANNLAATVMTSDDNNESFAQTVSLLAKMYNCYYWTKDAKCGCNNAGHCAAKQIDVLPNDCFLCMTQTDTPWREKH